MAERSKIGGLRERLAASWSYAFPIAVIVGAILFVQSRRQSEVTEVEVIEATVTRNPLTDEAMGALAVAIGKAWAGEPVDRAALPARLTDPPQSVYVAFRSGGRKQSERWVHPGDQPAAKDVWDLLEHALAEARARPAGDEGRITRLEIDLTRSYRALDGSKQERLVLDEYREKVPRHRGVRGLRVANGERLAMWAPTAQIADNRSNRDRLEELRGAWSMTEDQVEASSFQTFEADQILVRLDRNPVEAVRMFRGNRVVGIEEVEKGSTERLAVGMKDWIVGNVRDSGRLTYMWLPSQAKEGPGNNMIRQWMATNAMIQWAADRGDDAVLATAEKNIDYNLGKFYSEDGELGRINEGEKVKLGAVALAGLALQTHPKREKWSRQLLGLRKMVEHLWREDGSFASFYAGSEDQQWNFYPGEALLFWATIYAEEKDPEILRRYRASFEFFRKWHLDPTNRNPAFVPWHLQANYTLWKALGDDEAQLKQELAAFNFEIADWLLGIQQWTAEEGVIHPDEQGRFYEPDKSFGIPHASATGVYIEGLIDAWRQAKDLSDATRREKYRVALVRALRSMMQLQFVDDVDTFYVADPKPVLGGLRTSEYNNDIRCDNVQHPLMGILKILKLFEEAEYRNAG